MFHLSTRVLTARSYQYLSLRPTCYAALRSYKATYHHSAYSPTTQNDVVRVGKFVLGSLLVIGTGFYIQREYGLPILPARLEAASASVQIASRSEFEEPLYALKTSSPEDLSDATATGGASDVLRNPSTSSIPTYGSPEDVGKAIEELREALPGKIQTNPDILRAHGSSDNSYHPSFAHSVVVKVHSTEEVVKVVNISRKYRIPIIASGGATSLEGHFSGVRLKLSIFYCLGEADGDG